jgi:N-acetylglucosaminyl-diphospho-decaprenol L-rhamnosyltransferase
MILSVIIVNYQVPYFLELCLHSVRLTLQGLDAEIIVVDNNSADGSAELLRPLFPEVHWIVNTENEGFSRANNQGLAAAAGEYILFLNPDTVLPEDFARDCLTFHQSTPNVGGLGVRMIDGNGQFLKESRRGFPTPWVAFCKLSGLTSLFPHSRRFSRYYLGYLPAGQPHPASVLSGACFLVSRTALYQTGPFDETFFMYAEDIDLSFRLEKAGYTNYYFPGTTIIHFKGESTHKDSRHIRQFYKAMIQFRRKHFNAGLLRLFRFIAEPAIWLRGGLAAIGGTFARRPNRAKLHRTWLTGDPAGIARINSALAASPGNSSAKAAASRQRIPAPDELHADEIIYCVGNEFSFESAIRALEKKSPHCTASFYFTGSAGKPGSHAVIGSSSRTARGETWIL